MLISAMGINYKNSDRLSSAQDTAQGADAFAFNGNLSMVELTLDSFLEKPMNLR